MSNVFQERKLTPHQRRMVDWLMVSGKGAWQLDDEGLELRTLNSLKRRGLVKLDDASLIYYLTEKGRRA